MPQDVREGLGDDEVGGRLDRRREPAVLDVDLDRDREPVGQLADGRREAAVGEGGGVDPAGERAKLPEAVLELSVRVVEQLRELRVRIGAPVRAPEREAEGHEPLLGPVVQVALDPPPLLVGRLDDPRPRRPDLLELGPQLGGQPLVLEGEPRRRRRALDELRVDGRVVDQDRDRAVGTLDPGDVAAIVAGGQLDRPARRVDVARRRRGSGTRAAGSGRGRRARGRPRDRRS